MLLVRRVEEKRAEWRAKRIAGGAEVEARKGDIRYVLRMVAVGKLKSVEEKMRKTDKNHHSLMASLQLTQKRLDGVRERLTKTNVLIKS